MRTSIDSSMSAGKRKKMIFDCAIAMGFKPIAMMKNLILFYFNR